MHSLDSQIYEKILDFLSVKFKHDAMKSMIHLISDIFGFESIFFLAASSDKKQLRYVSMTSKGNSFQEIEFSLENFKHPFSQIAYKKKKQEIEVSELRIWQSQSREFNELILSENLENGLIAIPVFYQDEVIYGCLILNLIDYRKQDIDSLFLEFLLTLIAQHFKNIESFRLKEDEGLYLTRSIARSEQTYLDYLKKIELQKNIIATTPMMESIVAKIAQVINSNVSLLFSGDSGTGKSFLAQACHIYSLKKEKPCIIVDCSERGSNWEQRFLDEEGLLSQSHKGILILENITELPKNIQEQLATIFLNEFYYIADSKTLKPFNARIITTTREHQSNILKKRLLLPEFFAQISQIIFSLPPLRERKGDIKFFIEKFIIQFNKQSETGTQLIGYNDQFLKKISTFDWNNNLHELQQYLEIKAKTSNDGVLKSSNHLYGKSPLQHQQRLIKDFVKELLDINSLELGALLKNIEISIIKQELEKNKGKRQIVANKLKVPLRTLAYKCQKYGM